MSSHMAYNPLPFMLTREGYKPELAPPLREILEVVKQSGYDGIHADIPAGSTPAAYLDLLAEYGLVPAPGYFAADFSDRDALPKTMETARKLVADHAKLGLDRIFLAEVRGILPERNETPAQGVNRDEKVLSAIAEGIGKVAAVMAAEGVIPCLHPHVGTRIETEAETEFVLRCVGRDVLLIGPDTGHMSWADFDLEPFLTRHADRIGAVHVKDYRRQVAEAIKAKGKSYQEAGAAGIWTEPGRGSIDLDGAMAALSGFGGWFVVEVDIADQPTVAESARVAGQWMRSKLETRLRS
ncbi:sugar phosphate isomerase/epimerase [Mesorhizobium sp. YR577]|uniref:sugar phosphate isomerase/epimerase family protein n=1 Tax=Mesorhizobium sp. YR577 TaxID=1884373 RepID=UPI0008EECE0A|nr:sugar phosphate isomerase/epimerase [Mesorhizobium sp. YR577]SFU17094.1 inosose dehydratase [Mesorhizobium sp. YR577]